MRMEKNETSVWSCSVLYILTPMLVLFFICLYISSRALSKAFEHRNFVARFNGKPVILLLRKLRAW